MSAVEVSGANLETKIIFIAGTIDNGLLPTCDGCVEMVTGKGALAEVGLVTFFLRVRADELASLVG